MSSDYRCEWCSNVGAGTFSYKKDLGTYKENIFVTTKNFCSRKCMAEYDDR